MFYHEFTLAEIALFMILLLSLIKYLIKLDIDDIVNLKILCELN